MATEIVVTSIGDKSPRTNAALALGADRGIQIDTDQNLDSLQVAKLLSKVVEEEQPQLVILGKQSIDSDNNQTGQMLAALLACHRALLRQKSLLTAKKRCNS